MLDRPSEHRKQRFVVMQMKDFITLFMDQPFVRLVL